MALRPDLNGRRMKNPNEPHVYLIDEGRRRWIPNPPTYNNLFRDWNGIILDWNIASIDRGSDISNGAVLARQEGMARVYLVDQGRKRWVTSPAAMDRYHFNWNAVRQVPRLLLQYVDSAPDISV
jgi:hypothetical protein